MMQGTEEHSLDFAKCLGTDHKGDPENCQCTCDEGLGAEPGLEVTRGHCWRRGAQRRGCLMWKCLDPSGAGAGGSLQADREETRPAGPALSADSNQTRRGPRGPQRRACQDPDSVFPNKSGDACVLSLSAEQPLACSQVLFKKSGPQGRKASQTQQRGGGQPSFPQASLLRRSSAL